MPLSVISKERILNEIGLRGGATPPDLEIFQCIDSTNTYLKSAAEGGARHGHTVIARSQTAGRGRMGRTFFSPVDTGLYISLLARPSLPSEDILMITPLAAVAVCRALERSGCRGAEIKWVNDIYVGGKKAAGILVEGAVTPLGGIDYAVTGIGVNLLPPRGGFPKEISDIACAVFDSPDKVDINRLISDIICEFFSLYDRLPDCGFMDEYRQRSFLLGKQVTVTRGNEEFYGIAVSIDDRGGITLECEDGMRRSFSSGEARAKPHR